VVVRDILVLLAERVPLPAVLSPAVVVRVVMQQLVVQAEQLVLELVVQVVPVV
jgi:hypothetical protein